MKLFTQIKECSVSLTNDESLNKHEIEKRLPVVPNETIKNINPKLHSLTTMIDCNICGKQDKCIVSHYVNEHPNNEVVISRLTPNVADTLRNLNDHKCKRLLKKGCVQYNQCCYFCNEILCLTKFGWKGHIAKHTGYYQFRCRDCAKKYAYMYTSHVCKTVKNLEKIPQPHFEKDVLKAFLCDRCNFVRFNQDEIEKHLSLEHDLDVTKEFEEVTFLCFPKKKIKRHERVRKRRENKIATIPQLQNANENLDLSQNLTDKVLRARVVKLADPIEQMQVEAANG